MEHAEQGIEEQTSHPLVFHHKPPTWTAPRIQYCLSLTVKELLHATNSLQEVSPAVAAVAIKVAIKDGDRGGEEQTKTAQYGRAAVTKMQGSTESEIFF